MPFVLIPISTSTRVSVQFEEATRFLENYMREIKILTTYPNIETSPMRFTAEDYDHKGRSDPPQRFLELFGKSGLGGLIIA
jgi:hypothetical protein